MRYTYQILQERKELRSKNDYMKKIDTGSKFKMAAAAILKIHLNGHNSVAIAHIHTKFGSETKTDVPETEIPPNFNSTKIQDGGRPPF